MEPQYFYEQYSNFTEVDVSSQQIQSGSQTVIAPQLYFPVFLLCIISIKHIIAKLEPGLYRFLLTLPFIAINWIAPAYFNYSGKVGIISFTVMYVHAWNANFRLIQFSMGRGELQKIVGNKNVNILQVAALYILPVIITLDKSQSRRQLLEQYTKPKSRDQRTFDDILLAVVTTGTICLCVFWQYIPSFARTYVAAMAASVIVSLVYDPLSIKAFSFIGLEVEPNFLEPHLSKSFGEFWSIRWNYMAAKSLRDTVYSPIMEGRLIAPQGGYKDTYLEQKTKINKRNPLKQVVASFLVFFLSGLLHQLLIWYVCHDTIGWKCTIFFTIQAPFMILEHSIYRYLATKRVQVPIIMRMVIFQVILMVSAHCLLILPLAQDPRFQLLGESLQLIIQDIVQKIDLNWLVNNSGVINFFQIALSNLRKLP